MNLRDFEEKVRRLPGVEAARVVTEGGAVTEVHILTGMNKAAKQVVRDVQSLAQAVFGLAIDRRVVSVVQLPDTDIAPGDRPVIVDVSEQVDGNHTRVVVTLGWQGETLVGEVAGAAAHTTRQRLVAEATIEALQQALQETTAIGVASVDVPVLGSRSVAIARVDGSTSWPSTPDRGVSWSSRSKPRSMTLGESTGRWAGTSETHGRLPGD